MCSISSHFVIFYIINGKSHLEKDSLLLLWQNILMVCEIPSAIAFTSIIVESQKGKPENDRLLFSCKEITVNIMSYEQAWYF